MAKMTPEKEAAYALDFGVARSDLPEEAQLAYDRLAEQRARARTSAPVPPADAEDGRVIWGFVRFATEGVGVPVPVEPTSRQLTVGGPYRYVRNPLYLAIVVVVTGQALLLSRPVLLIYAAVFLAAFAAFVHWYEEPSLARRFGAQYEAYRKQVPAWWPRLRRRTP
jgi:Phospholipid methyltransferase